MKSRQERKGGFSLTRRRVLIAVGGGGVAVGAVGVVGLHRLREAPPRLERSRGTESLADPELAVIVGLAQVLVPERYWLGTERTADMIKRAVDRRSGLGHAYREGAVLLEERAKSQFGNGFADLSRDERDEVLRELLWRFSAEFGETTPHVRGATRVRAIRRRAERAWLNERRTRFRDLVMSDLLERLYLEATPCVLGYENTQGVPGGPRAYVDAPEPAGEMCGNGA